MCTQLDKARYEYLLSNESLQHVSTQFDEIIKGGADNRRKLDEVQKKK